MENICQDITIIMDKKQQLINKLQINLWLK